MAARKPRPKRAPGSDARAWLLAHGHAPLARLIDQLTARWRAEGKKTKRNWWEILAGDTRGRARRVGGHVFPVLAEARARQRKTAPAARGRGKAAPRRNGRAKPYPFLKWAGGKRQILGEILQRLPREFRAFHEPFVGGGAVFFALKPRHAFLSDSNERLIRTYRGIKESVGEVMALLDGYHNEKKFFLEMRRKEVDSLSDAQLAAWMIYLNKTGFNGLYRVNSRNLYNVPFGDNKTKFYDPENLQACALALEHATLTCEDFAAVLERARTDDVVYFDPPYVPLSTTSYFTSYTKDGFGLKDQERLRDVAVELKKRGVFVLLSNSAAPVVRDLYRDFRCDPVSVTRMVNSDVTGRGRIHELLIR